MIKINGKITLDKGGRVGLVSRVVPYDDAGKSRDYQVSKVYKSEYQAEAVSPAVLSAYPPEHAKGVVASFVKSIGEDVDFTAMFGKCKITLSIRPDLSRSQAIDNEIDLAFTNGSISSYDITHEMAHALNPVLDEPHHGIAFTSLYLYITRIGLGERCYTSLRNAFINNKVKFVDLHTSNK